MKSDTEFRGDPFAMNIVNLTGAMDGSSFEFGKEGNNGFGNISP